MWGASSQARDRLVLSTLRLSGPLWASLGLSQTASQPPSQPASYVASQAHDRLPGRNSASQPASQLPGRVYVILLVGGVGLAPSDDVGSAHGDFFCPPAALGVSVTLPVPLALCMVPTVCMYVCICRSSSAQPHMSGQNVVPSLAQIKVCSTSFMDLPKCWQPKSRAETNPASLKS